MSKIVKLICLNIQTKLTWMQEMIMACYTGHRDVVKLENRFIGQTQKFSQEFWNFHNHFWKVHQVGLNFWFWVISETLLEPGHYMAGLATWPNPLVFFLPFHLLWLKNSKKCFIHQLPSYTEFSSLIFIPFIENIMRQ